MRGAHAADAEAEARMPEPAAPQLAAEPPAPARRGRARGAAPAHGRAEGSTQEPPPPSPPGRVTRRSARLAKGTADASTAAPARSANAGASGAVAASACLPAADGAAAPPAAAGASSEGGAAAAPPASAPTAARARRARTAKRAAGRRAALGAAAAAAGSEADWDPVARCGQQPMLALPAARPQCWRAAPPTRHHKLVRVCADVAGVTPVTPYIF